MENKNGKTIEQDMNHSGGSTNVTWQDISLMVDFIASVVSVFILVLAFCCIYYCYNNTIMRKTMIRNVADDRILVFRKWKVRIQGPDSRHLAKKIDKHIAKSIVSLP